MRKRYRLALSVVVLAPLALSQAGCLLAAAAAGTAGGVMYVKGDTHASVEADPKTVARVAVEAVREMEMVLVSNSATSADGKVVARTAADTKVVIVAKAQGRNASSVSIRVGNFGDEMLQDDLLKRIREKVKETPDTVGSDVAVAGE